MTAIDNRDETPLLSAKPVRSFLSDRALNKLRIPQTHDRSNGDKLHGHPLSYLKKQLHSDPKLYTGTLNERNKTSILPGRSLNQMYFQSSSQSDFSKTTTSETSNFETAPLHESTSFSTPLEDFWSSSINGNSSAMKSLDTNPSSNYISCENEDINESFNLPSNRQSDCRRTVQMQHFEESTLTTSNSLKLGESSTNKSFVGGISGSSSSICGPNISDFSTDTDESHRECLNTIDHSDNCSLLYPKTAEDQKSDVKLSFTQIQNSKDNNNETQILLKAKLPNYTEESPRLIKESDIAIESKPTGGARAKTNRNTASRKSSSKKFRAPNSLRNTSARNHQASNCYDNSGTNEILGCLYDGTFNRNFMALPVSSENRHLMEPPVEERIDYLRRELYQLEMSNQNKTSGEPRERISRLRHHIFRLERELILLQLDQAESIDL